MLFNGAADIAVFLGLLERAAKERGLDVHAFCILGTHFHLLVSTPGGDTSSALGWVQDLYARYFNRTRNRDGHVVKARYWSRVVDDAIYLVIVIAYIDRNPLAARLGTPLGAYPYSSARAYLGENVFPWLRRDVVEDMACRLAGRTPYRPDAYPALWSACAAEVTDPLLDNMGDRPGVRLAPITSLLRAGPVQVQRWLQESALREDGNRGLTLALGSSAVDVLVAEASATCRQMAGMGILPVRASERPLQAGLLHALAGQTLDAIAGRLGVSRTQVAAAVAKHRDSLRRDPRYAAFVAKHVERALRQAYGGALR